MTENKSADKRSSERKEIDDWMFGSGGKILGGIMILLGTWFIVSRFL